jgi:hypothetical protein
MEYYLGSRFKCADLYPQSFLGNYAPLFLLLLFSVITKRQRKCNQDTRQGRQKPDNSCKNKSFVVYQRRLLPHGSVTKELRLTRDFGACDAAESTLTIRCRYPILMVTSRSHPAMLGTQSKPTIIGLVTSKSPRR